MDHKRVLNPDTSTILKVSFTIIPIYSCHQHSPGPMAPGLKRSNLIKTPSPVTFPSLIDLKSMGCVNKCHLQSSDLKLSSPAKLTSLLH